MTYEKRIPLLKDHHTHPSLYASLSNSLDLRNVSGKAEALALIRENDEEINVVFGWNNSLYSFEKEELESLAPVFICNVSLHSFLMNTPAKEMLYSPCKDIVTNIEDHDWVEKNLPEIFKFIVNINPVTPGQIASYYAYLNRQGVWYAEEMLLPNRATIDSHGELGYLDRTLFWADLDLFRSLDYQTRNHVFGIKLFADGALGPRTAAIQEPYPTGGRGILIYSNDELYDILDTVTDLEKPAAVHAIGDTATGQVISVLGRLKQTKGVIPPLVRMEHCQFISEANAHRAKSLGMILSMQPNFNSDSVQYRDRLSGKYCSRNNPFRMLIDTAGFIPGKDLIFSSDGMPHGVKYALEMALFPPVPNQRLTLEEFIAGYCLDTQENGYIDIQVDEDKQTVLSRVVIKKW